MWRMRRIAEATGCAPPPVAPAGAGAGGSGGDAIAAAVREAGAKWPERWPWPEDGFRRSDESPDTEFYAEARLVYHIDDEAVAALRAYYTREFAARPGADILDLCSSWVSHFPEQKTWRRAVGLGMVAAELAENKQLDSYDVRDLNADPRLPYGDASFDVVTCCVSFDYLAKPLQVMREVRRVLRPGGSCILSQSNRCFPSKAIAMWHHTDDAGHAVILASYFHYAGGFAAAEARDVSPNAGETDPLFIVRADRAG